ncbi:MAG: hypothetical protein GXP55_03270 [Deltaproteobacteria bacterium]|nr:hypothetical protein [Deltaproteobacteria bacterium]
MAIVEDGRVPWVALVGRREEGRAVAALRLVEHLRERGVPLGGFLQRPVFTSDAADEEAVAYEAESLRTGERVRVASHGDDPSICDWSFDPVAFERARGWVLEPSAHVSFVELGPLEARGEGHLPAAHAALTGRARLLVFCIRPHVLASIGLELPDPIDGLELPEEAADVDTFAARVAELASQPRAAAH